MLQVARSQVPGFSGQRVRPLEEPVTWNLRPVTRMARYASAPVEAPAAPVTDTEIDWQLLAERFPPYRVILHNDDVHSMDYVVAALRKSVPGLRARKAILIMLEAHLTGRATVVVCPREQAELYAERLGTFGLTVTIEPER
jgi:ATP-dependent Clp protease adaptor protein ClpS